MDGTFVGVASTVTHTGPLYVFRNVYIIIACSPELAPEIVEAVRPFLRRHGGMCLLSEAFWVMH